MSADELREAEAAAVFAPDNAHAVARGLGYVRDHDLWKVRGYGSWREYVDEMLGVPVIWVILIVDAAEQWRSDPFRGQMPDVPHELQEALEAMEMSL